MSDKDTLVVKLDPVEYGAVCESLIDERNERIRENQPHEAYDNALLKMHKAKRARSRGWRDEAR